MIWKPKEKELTAEEAIALAIEDLTPYWFGSVPRIAGIKTPQGYVALPLDKEFGSHPWLIFFIDPTDFSGQTALIYAQEWFKRYSSLHLQTLAIFYQTYQFYENPEPVRELVERFNIEFPSVMDFDGNLARAFNATALPMVLLLNQGRYGFRHMGKDWEAGTELSIQKFLRSTDPGLALLNIFEPEKEEAEGAPLSLAKDSSRLEFGFQPKVGEALVFPSPGFHFTTLGSGVTGDSSDQASPLVKISGTLGGITKKQNKDLKSAVPKIKTGKFQGARPERVGLKQIFLSGEWTQDRERMMTSDPEATLTFRSDGKRVSLIAQSLSQIGENALVHCELEGGAAFDSIVGEDLFLEETGESLVKVSKPFLYHLFVNLPEEQREITLRFPNASKVSIAIYGVRFGD